jgi:hypothetical protein
MPYTFWHNGILIGESELDEPGSSPRQRAGVFHPTTYGLEVYPRLTGFLSAGKALKELLTERGLDLEQLDQPDVEEIIDTTPAGHKILDIGRALSEVVVRGPDGPTVHVASIAFIDLEELQSLSYAMHLDTPDLSEVPPDGPRYVVSLTVHDQRNGNPIGTR